MDGYGYPRARNLTFHAASAMGNLPRDEPSQRPGSGSSSGLNSLEGSDEFGRMLIQRAKDERRLQGALRGNVQPFRKADKNIRYALTFENLERTEQQPTFENLERRDGTTSYSNYQRYSPNGSLNGNEQQPTSYGRYQRYSPNGSLNGNEPQPTSYSRYQRYSPNGSLNGSEASDPPVRAPHEWGRKARVDRSWLRRIAEPDPLEQESPGEESDTIYARKRVYGDTTSPKGYMAGYNQDVPLPSVEHSSGALRHAARDTPPSIKRHGTFDWDLTEDLTSGSLLASTPAIPRNTRLDEIRQREIECANDIAYMPDPLESIRDPSPEPERRPNSAPESEKTLPKPPPPQPLLREKSESQLNLPKRLEKLKIKPSAPPCDPLDEKIPMSIRLEQLGSKSPPSPLEEGSPLFTRFENLRNKARARASSLTDEGVPVPSRPEQLGIKAPTSIDEGLPVPSRPESVRNKAPLRTSEQLRNEALPRASEQPRNEAPPRASTPTEEGRPASSRPEQFGDLTPIRPFIPTGEGVPIPGTPVVVYKTSPEEQEAWEKAKRQRGDPLQLLKALARATSKSPSPNNNSDEGNPRKEHNQYKESPLAKKQTERLAENKTGLPTPSPDLEESSEQESPTAAKTPLVTGAWVDTPAPRNSHHETRSTSRNRPPAQTSPKKKGPEKSSQPKEPANPKGKKAILPKSALSIIVGKAKKGLSDLYGDSTIESLEGLMSPLEKTAPTEQDEDTLHELQVPTGRPKTAAERERQQELLQLRSMNARLRAARSSIREANRNVRHLEHEVDAAESPAGGEQRIDEYRFCNCPGHPSPLYTMWSCFKALFCFENANGGTSLTWFGLISLIFFSWLVSELTLGAIFCPPTYASTMRGFGVNPNAPRHPYVVFTVLSWIPPLNWMIKSSLYLKHSYARGYLLQ